MKKVNVVRNEAQTGEGKWWLSAICHDCGAKAGELHSLGCDMERCPICKGQLISCQQKHFEWAESGKVTRIPYIQPLVNCAACGQIFPEFFEVLDGEWDKYVIPPLKKEVVCKGCYDSFKALFPNGWRNARDMERNNESH